MSSFKSRYPDFASIEYQIRQAHAERSVAIATALADGIVAAIQGLARMFVPRPARAANGPVAAKASASPQAARV